MTKRKFTAEEKFKILEEARQPGASVAEVCRRNQIASSLFYKWESEAKKGALEALNNKKRRAKVKNSFIPIRSNITIFTAIRYKVRSPALLTIPQAVRIPFLTTWL